MESGRRNQHQQHGHMHGDGEWRRWAVLVATVWVQALTGTNFDFSAYSSALKSSLGVSQEALNYLATASDLGKALGWSSGLALLHMPLAAVLLLSAAMGLASYALQYCILSSSTLAVPYPLVFLICLIAGCSISWFNTVCFVICIRSFSASSRPLALSLSISFNGLSAAFYTLFANALSPYSPSAYLLLNAVLPLAVSIVALPAILLCHPHDHSNLHSVPKHDKRVFLGFYIIAFITGIYLVIFGSVTTISSSARVVLTGAMALLALPLIIPAATSSSHLRTHGPDPALPFNPNDPQKPLLLNNDHQRETNGSIMQKSVECQLQGGCCGTILEKGRMLVLGEEHSAKRLIRCVDFWLYYTAYFCGATVGLVYSNNLGQIAQSLHLQSQITMLLAVYSSCSFFGRLLSALPDFLHRKVSFARTGWLVAALVPMPMAFFLMWKLHDEYTLVAGTALIGLSSGFIFAAAVSVTSELFGPNSIGVNHNILITNIPLGSLLYGQIAALVYDANGRRMTVVDNRAGTVDTMVMCMGAKCYSTTFFVWGCITLLGLASSVVLFLRTRPAYATATGQSSCKHRSQVSS